MCPGHLQGATLAWSEQLQAGLCCSCNAGLPTLGLACPCPQPPEPSSVPPASLHGQKSPGPSQNQEGPESAPIRVTLGAVLGTAGPQPTCDPCLPLSPRRHPLGQDASSAPPASCSGDQNACGRAKAGAPGEAGLAGPAWLQLPEGRAGRRNTRGPFSPGILWAPPTVRCGWAGQGEARQAQRQGSSQARNTEEGARPASFPGDARRQVDPPPAPLQMASASAIPRCPARCGEKGWGGA